MAKETIGFFSCGEKRYNIFFCRGYRKQSDMVFVGNSTFGTFFAFAVNIGAEVYFYPKRGRSSRPVRLVIPEKEGELQRLLEMVLRPRGCVLSNDILKYETRDAIRNKIFGDAL